MKIKTIRSASTDIFDICVNDAMDEGWRLSRREILSDHTLYAELVKVDEAPAPDPLEALRVVRDFCEEMPTEKCLGKCPLTPWCAMYAASDISPADWEIPEEDA
jgi:hypothetical protein